MRIHPVLVLVSLAAAAGCERSPEVEGAGSSSASSSDAVVQSETEARPVATIEGLSRPEAVRYDPEQDVYFVANFGPREGDDPRDANGFISRVSPEGAIDSLRFMVGNGERPLHMPRGMWIRGDTLWVADQDGVHGFDRRSGEWLAFVDFTAHEPGFLNDIAAAPDGALYVTDTGRNRVYRVADGRAEVALEGAEMGPPNGITWDEGRQALLLAPWEGEAILRAWRPGEGSGGGALEEAGRMPGGRVDGIEVVDGRILATSQADSSLYWVGADGAERLTRVPGAPADIGVDTRRGRVAVPYIALDRVELYDLAPEAGGAAAGDTAAGDTASAADTAAAPADSVN